MSSSDLTLKKESEEVACCRVCHGESEPDNQLFYPCKCDGSIKYVHQECLVQWLKASRQKQPKCELCGEKYHFQNVYKDGAPNRLSIFELILELLPRIVSISKTVVYVLCSIFFWGICLPLFTSWWVKFCWCMVSNIDTSHCSVSILPLVDSIEHISLAWYNGVVNICVIVAISVLCFEVGQIIYREYDIAEKNRNIRILERQLIDNLERLRQFEDERRMSEVRQMCINDYQSLKLEWDTVKHESEIHLAAAQEANPFMTNKEMNEQLLASLRIDVQYTTRMIKRLEEIGEIPDLEYFGQLKECYVRVNDVLVKHIGTGNEGADVDETIDIDERSERMINSLVADPLLKDVVLKQLRETDTLTKIDGQVKFSGASEPHESEDILKFLRHCSQQSSAISSSNVPEVKENDEGEACDEFGRVIYDNTDYERRGREMMKKYYEQQEAAKKVVESQQQSQDDGDDSNEFDLDIVEVVESCDKPAFASDIDVKGEEEVNVIVDSDVSQSSVKIEAGEVPYIRPLPPRAIELNGRLFEALPLPNNLNINNQLNQIAPVVPLVENNNNGEVVPPNNGEVNQIVLPDLAAPAIAGDGILLNHNNNEFGLKYLMICTIYILFFVILVLVLPALIGRFLVEGSALPDALKARAKIVIQEMLEHEHIHNVLSTKLFVDYDALIAKAEALSAAATAASSATASTTDEVKPLLAEVFYGKFKVLIEIMVGYGVYSLACLMLYVGYCIHYARAVQMYRVSSMVDFCKAQAVHIKTGVIMITKLTLLLTIYGGVLPIGTSLLISKPLAKSVGVNISLEIKQPTEPVGPTDILNNGILTTFSLDPVQVVFGAFLYLFSILFMAHVLTVACELRGLIHKDYLVSFLPIKTLFELPQQLQPNRLQNLQNINQVMNQIVNNPNNVIIEQVNGVPQIPLLQNNGRNGVVAANAPMLEIRLDGQGQGQREAVEHSVANLTFTRIFRKFLVNVAILVPSILVSIIIPFRFGHYISPFSGPLLFRFKSTTGEVQIPVEMILSHIFLPILLEKMNYRTNIRRLMTWFLAYMCRVLKLEWILSPEAFPVVPEQPAPVPELIPVVPVGGIDVVPLQPPVLVEQNVEEQQVNQEEPLVEQEPIINQELVAENNEKKEVSVESEEFPGVEMSDVLSIVGEDDVDDESSNAEAEWSELKSVSSVDPVEDDTVEFDLHQVNFDHEDYDHSDVVLPDNRDVIESVEDLSDPKALVEDCAVEEQVSEPVVNVEQENIPAIVEPPINEASEDVSQQFTLASLPQDLRVAILVLCGMILMGIVSSWTIHIPLTVGRMVVSFCSIPATNDVFNFPVGLIVCWGSSYVFDYIIKDLVNNFNVPSIVRVVAKWGLIVLKMTALGLIWLIVPPMAIGLIVESLFIIPLRTPIKETPQYPFLQCWAIGLILFKVWARCVLTGMFGDIPLRLQFEQILIRGFAQFDAWSTLINVIVPVIIRLLDLLLIPFFLARTSTIFIHSYLIRTILVRFSIHIYIALKVLFFVIRHVYRYLITLHNEVRDSRYLIGTKLTNRKKIE